MIFNKYCGGRNRITWKFVVLAIIMSLLVSGVILFFIHISSTRGQRNSLSYSKAEPVQLGTNFTILSPFDTSHRSNFSCPRPQFACNSSRTCLDLGKRCDGQVDCPKAEDELNCVCAFRMPASKFCDKYPDCFDESDESFCSYCPDGYFNCGDGKCIPRRQVCDSRVNCDNFMDENFCFR